MGVGVGSSLGGREFVDHAQSVSGPQKPATQYKEVMMSKIIVNYPDGAFTDKEVMALVSHVVDCGLVSETERGKQYCFASTFQSLSSDNEITVLAKLTKSGTHVFTLNQSGGKS